MHKKHINKINYIFKQNPQNLKYNECVVKAKNFNYGWHDIFEVFISYKDNKEYIVFSDEENKDNYLYFVYYFYHY